jgi:hypothetical protein
MLAEAQGSSEGGALELHVQLERTAPQLRETLEHFRRQTLAAEGLVMSSSGRRWGELDLEGLGTPGGHAGRMRATPDLQKWVSEYRNGDRSDAPRLVPTGYSDFDSAMAELHDALQSCLAASRAAGDTHEARMTRFRAEPHCDFGDGWLGSKMIAYDSDCAVGMVLTSYDDLKRQPGWGHEAATAAAEHVRSHLATVPPAPPAPQRVQHLLDVLDLPIWQRRHELYSVWIATLAKRAADRARLEWRWRPQEGVLSFAFSGSLVAELDCGGQTAYLWAELRRKGAGQSRKGRRNVQPDYTLLLGPDRHISPAGMVLECKQYRRPSASNFTAALEDYAAAHEFAPVALVNYGTAGSAAETTSEALSASRDAPVAAFGLVHPTAPGEAEALEWLAEKFAAAGSLARILSAMIDLPEGEPHVGIAAEIQLSWTEGGDLDLHLVKDDGERVDYKALGSLDGSPWMKLDQDVQRPGTERAKIAQECGGRCMVQVHLFAGEAPAPGAATVKVVCGDLQRTFASPVAAWPLWTVCRIDLARRSITA